MCSLIMKQVRHIVHFAYSLYIGGMELMLIAMANEQVRRGFKVSVVIVNDEIDPALLSKFLPEINVVAMQRKRGSRPYIMMARLNMLVARLRPDALHFHHPKFRKLIRLYRKRQILTIHDINTPMIYAGDCPIAAITDAVADYVRSIKPQADITVVLNGICTDAIRKRPQGEAHKPFRIVQLANLYPAKKGQDILIKAIGELYRRGNTDITVDFIGGGASSAPLEELAIEEGVAQSIHFKGQLPQEIVYRQLADYDAMVHPSRYEGFGLITAEAMAAGLPLVLTEHDGPWEVADHGRLCRSGENGNPTSFADAIEDMICNYASALSSAAEAQVYSNRYSIARTVDDYLMIYQRLLNA